jgi:hypothetical protein
VNFTRPLVYEWPLGTRLAGVSDGIIVIAFFDTGYGRVASYVSFGAEQRGIILDPDAPNKELSGCEWRKRLLSGPTYYSHQLTENPTTSGLATIIDGIARQELVGRTAADGVWTLFWRLVLKKRAGRDWAAGLGDEWLAKLCRDEAHRDFTAHRESEAAK